MKKPFFSVIIPTLNEEKFLPRLLTSLAQQTEKPFEVIVVDGNSKDKTVPVAKKFSVSLPLTIVESKEASLPLQRNLGAKRAKGEWNVFIDADTVLLPHFFARVHAYIEKEQPKFFTTWFVPDGDKAIDAIMMLLGNAAMDGYILLNRPWSPGPLTIVRRDVFELVGGYDEQRTYNEDHDFSIRVHKKGIPFSIFHETLAVYSFRRYRQQGMLKPLQTQIKSFVGVLLTNQAPSHMPGYDMGGHLYEKPKEGTVKLLDDFQRELRSFINQFFGS